MFRIIICSLMLSGAIGEVVRDTPCDFNAITFVKNVNLTRIAGDWNQLRRIKNSLESGSCSTLTLAVHQTDNSLHVELSNKEVIEKKAYVHKGEIIADNFQGPFSMKYTNVSFESVIVATDYSNYALIYSCNPGAENKSSVFSWIYSRSLTLEQVLQNSNFTEALNSIDDLKNATWIEPKHTTEACEVSAGIVSRFSPIFGILTMLVISKDFFVTN